MKDIEIEKYNINDKGILKYIKFNKEATVKIINNNSKLAVKILQPNNNIEIIYTLKNCINKVYYYHCSKRPQCKGKAKIIRSEQKFYITYFCKEIDINIKLSYKIFSNLIKDNKINNVDFDIKKNQQNLIE